MVKMTGPVFVQLAFSFILRYNRYRKTKEHRTQLSQLNANMERLIEQIADANNKRYGRSSEKLDVIAGQLELELIFNEAEALTETLYVVEPAEEDVIQVRRRKRKGKREEDLKDLPVEVVSHTLSEEKLRELFGDNGWTQLPNEVYKRVRVQPAVYTVEEHHVAVYAGRDNQTIVKADRPKDLLRNSILTPTLAASIMNAKYVMDFLYIESVRNSCGMISTSPSR